MASRFWGDSDSDKENDINASQDKEIHEEVVRANPNRYLRGNDGSDSDDSDAIRRFIKPTSKRRDVEMQSTLDQIVNATKINDWVNLLDSFEKLNKQFEKICRLNKCEKVPDVYIKALVLMEDFLAETLTNKEVNKMSGSNAKAFNSMKQKLKKHNKQYEELIAKYRENSINVGNKEDEDKKVKSDRSDKKGEDKKKNEDEDKKVKSDRSDKKGEDKKKNEDEDKKVKSDRSDKKDEDKKKNEEESDPSKRGRACKEFYNNFLKNPSKITWENVNDKLKEFVSLRGKKGTSRLYQVDDLTNLAYAAKTPAQKLEIMLHVISAQFDVNPSLLGHMPVLVWKQTATNMLHVLDILNQYPNIIIDDSLQIEGKDSQKGADFEGTIRIQGNLGGFLERLDAELFKSLQGTDAFTKDYVERLRDEPLFLAVAQNVQEYLVRIGDFRSASRVALPRVEMVYYKPEEVYNAMRKLPEQSTGEDEGPKMEGQYWKEGTMPFVQVPKTVPRRPTFPESSRDFMDDLVSLIYEHGDERTKIRAMLCVIYHHAILDEFHVARDLLLTGRLQDKIQNMDASCQILFNRATAQLGLCAFRAGLINEAHSCLTDLYQSGRIRELLAQGVYVNLYQQKPLAQERAERRRQMPYHMYINLEILEASHLISAMLLEVPNMVSSFYIPRKPISKLFRRLFEISQRQAYVGPPENVREHVASASRSMIKGDHQKCFETLSNLGAWEHVRNKETVLEMLRTRVKEESLRTYLIMYSRCYESIGWDRLVVMFDLKEERVRCILNKMIMVEELNARLDKPARCIVFHNVGESRKLQGLIYQMADKLSILVDNNEKAYEAGTGKILDWVPKRLGMDNQEGGNYNYVTGLQNRQRFGGRSRGGSLRPVRFWDGRGMGYHHKAIREATRGRSARVGGSIAGGRGGRAEGDRGGQGE